MWNWIKSLFSIAKEPLEAVDHNGSQYSLGANIDTRTEAEKATDVHFSEIVASANAVPWTEKPISSWRSFPVRNQGKGFSCVANTLAKIMGILIWLKNGEYVAFSAADIYRRRSPREEGMSADNAFAIAATGVTLEAVIPSDMLSDEQIDALRPQKYTQDIGAVFPLGKQVILPFKDIDTVASVINTTGKPVMVWFFFAQPEWSSFMPLIANRGLTVEDGLRHSVTAVDFTMYNGKKALIIEDSAWFGNISTRVITEDFFKTRNWYAAYPMSFKFDAPVGAKPVYTGTTVSLQDCLKYEGVFPTNVSSSGVYGSVTTQAVKDFQKKYGLEQVGLVGPQTTEKLKELYS